MRGKIRVGEWCCEVVGSCEVQQGEVHCEVRFSTSSQPKNLYVCVCVLTRVAQIVTATQTLLRLVILHAQTF